MGKKWVTSEGKPVAPVRITADTVRALADRASDLTLEGFGQVTIYNPGDGRRYVMSGWQTFTGRDATRYAAAFLYGVVESANPGLLGDLPEGIRAAGRELVRWRESAVDAGRSAYSAWQQAQELGKRSK